MNPDRERLRSIIRTSLDRYRGGRFSVEGSGGASGMLMFYAPNGSQWFCGGLNSENAQPICNALNAMVELMAADGSRNAEQ